MMYPCLALFVGWTLTEAAEELCTSHDANPAASPGEALLQSAHVRDSLTWSDALDQSSVGVMAASEDPFTGLYFLEDAASVSAQSKAESSTASAPSKTESLTESAPSKTVSAASITNVVYKRVSMDLLNKAGYNVDGYQGSPACMPVEKEAANQRVALLTLSRGQEPVGVSAPLDAAGFKKTTSLCCPHEMEQFFSRILHSKGYDVCSKPHFQGLMHWFTCVPDMKFQYVLDIIANGNPCKYWALMGETCPPLSLACEGQHCGAPLTTEATKKPTATTISTLSIQEDMGTTSKNETIEEDPLEHPTASPLSFEQLISLGSLEH